jgi:hypothetical protein
MPRAKHSKQIEDQAEELGKTIGGHVAKQIFSKAIDAFDKLVNVKPDDPAKEGKDE